MSFRLMVISSISFLELTMTMCRPKIVMVRRSPGAQGSVLVREATKRSCYRTILLPQARKVKPLIVRRYVDIPSERNAFWTRRDESTSPLELE